MTGEELGAALALAAAAAIGLALGVGGVRRLRRHRAAHRGVSEREVVASDLAETRERLSAIVASLSSNRIVLLDRDGRIAEVVEHRELPPPVHGLTREQVERRSIKAFVPGPEGERLLAAIAEVCDTGKARHLLQEVELPGGRFHFDVTLRPLHGRTGSIEQVLAVCSDVTERVAEERRRRELEQQILQAQKLESLGLLAGGVAHDFNNLLSGILGNVDLALSRVGPDSPLHGLLVGIEQASVHANDLTEQLLAYAGKASISLEPLDLSAVVREMGELLRSQLAGGASLEIDASQECWVRADATRIRQLLMNLITNAGEAIPGGRLGRVRIRTDRLRLDASPAAPGSYEIDPPGAGDYVVFEVEDDGCGMDAETRKQIFDPFFSTKFRGRGLGLAGVLGIVRTHRGSLQVHTAPGRGTTFRILIPAGPPPEAGRERTPVRDAAWTGEGTVLIADDRAEVRSVAGRMVSALGFRPRIAAGGREAVELFRSHRDQIVAVLCDVGMEGWDGSRVASELRELAPELPIVFMTGLSERDADERLGAPIGPVLRKPFRLAQVRDALRDALTR